jgi:YidC/Oxa1 family membrane protein insertase
MDKNSITGVILIVAIVFGYNMLYPPVIEPTIEETEKNIILEENKQENKEAQRLNDLPVKNDSISKNENFSKYGSFAISSSSDAQPITLENELLELTISPKGGRLTSVILKKYKTSDSLPLNLISEDSSKFNLSFFSENRRINSEELYFEANEQNENMVSMKLYAENGGYLEYVYKLNPNQYMVDFEINHYNLQNLIASNQNTMDLEWGINLPHIEKSIDNERMYSTTYFKYLNDEVDYLSETKDDNEELAGRAHWIGFKHQFFSSVLINNKGFEKPTNVSAKNNEFSTDYVRDLSATISLAYDHKKSAKNQMQFYFGPNHYQTLSSYNLELEKMIPLGWGIFRWVNKYAVIPIFNLLSSWISNYGIIILIMTFIIKMVLAPFTLKAYLSQAKMKVLKPEIDKIQEKHKEKDPMKAQQEVMALYKKTGVNPLGGCIPMLLQMPILFALFRFFPASIELRQQKFLWADDLSSYDSILSLPFEIPFYGDHVSLFTLLMTVSTLLYTRMNNQMSGPQMAQMKWMMYLMPIMFLGFFNNYAAGLSYYYFLANMVTFGQQFVMRKYFIDEENILKQMEQNKKKPIKKSKFQKRLEEMAKKQQEMAKKK